MTSNWELSIPRSPATSSSIDVRVASSVARLCARINGGDALSNADGSAASTDAIDVKTEGVLDPSAITPTTRAGCGGLLEPAMVGECADGALEFYGRVREPRPRTLHALPDHGLGYGLLRYLNPQTAGQLAGLPAPQIGFNYLGRFAAPAAADWGPAPEAPRKARKEIKGSSRVITPKILGGEEVMLVLEMQRAAGCPSGVVVVVGERLVVKLKAAIRVARNRVIPAT